MLCILFECNLSIIVMIETFNVDLLWFIARLDRTIMNISFLSLRRIVFFFLIRLSYLLKDLFLFLVQCFCQLFRKYICKSWRLGDFYILAFFSIYLLLFAFNLIIFFFILYDFNLWRRSWCKNVFYGPTFFTYIAVAGFS